jgi:zinc transport system substrate-binding protein/iron/zinc/copper transport system substrate-binding protein
MQKMKGFFTRQRISVLMFLMGGILFLNFLSPASAQEAVVASTSLAGAIAKAAGAKEVRVMVSSEIRHPPEYDLKPSDLFKFEGAKVVIYGGYERMVSKLLETSKSKNILAIQINTDTSPENLISQARKISEVLKTEKEEQLWEGKFLEKLKEFQKKIGPFSKKRAVVHRFAQPFAQWAGLEVVQIVSPGELTPKVIGDAIAKHPELVVDIYHFPIAQVIAENAKCKYVQVINFPGIENTQSLEDIFEYNSKKLRQIFQSFPPNIK